MISMVRIWCTPLYFLNRQRLLGEHHELHIILSAILRGKGAWYNHPQTKRFYKHIGQLIDRHNQQVEEFKRRKYKHHSPLYNVNGIEAEAYVYSREEMLGDLAILSERQKEDMIIMYL